MPKSKSKLRKKLEESIGYEKSGGHFYNNRVMCDVLSEMRECHNTRNYAALQGLIEEVQSMANRMEAGLRDVKDLRELSEELSERRRQLKKLRKLIEKELGKV